MKACFPSIIRIGNINGTPFVNRGLVGLPIEHDENLFCMPLHNCIYCAYKQDKQGANHFLL